MLVCDTEDEDNGSGGSGGQGQLIKLSAVSAVQNVRGTGRADEILGSTAANVLDGGDGTDILDGGGGNDTLTGGAGSDLFVLSTQAGTSTISDFTPGEDQLDMRAFHISSLSQLNIQAGSVVISTQDGAHRMVLEGLESPDDLDIRDFMLVAAPNGPPAATTPEPSRAERSAHLRGGAVLSVLLLSVVGAVGQYAASLMDARDANARGSNGLRGLVSACMHLLLSLSVAAAVAACVLVLW